MVDVVKLLSVTKTEPLINPGPPREILQSIGTRVLRFGCCARAADPLEKRTAADNTVVVNIVIRLIVFPPLDFASAR